MIPGLRFLLSQSSNCAKGPGGADMETFPGAQAHLDGLGLQPMRRFDPQFPALWLEIEAIQTHRLFETPPLTASHYLRLRTFTQNGPASQENSLCIFAPSGARIFDFLHNINTHGREQAPRDMAPTVTPRLR